MPAVTNATSRRMYSDFVKGCGTYQDEAGVDFNFATVEVKGTLSIDPIGTPLVWDNTAECFNVFIAQTIADATTSVLPAKYPVCVTVGTAEGRGFGTEDVLLTTTAQKFTVIFRGKASLSEAGMDWGTAAEAAQDLFKTELEKQDMSFVSSTTNVVPSYVS